MTEEIKKKLFNEIERKATNNIVTYAANPYGPKDRFDASGKVACRAFTFTRDLAYRVKKSNVVTCKLIEYWINEGLELFDIKDDLVSIEDHDTHVFVYLSFSGKKLTPSICQWFLFPSYTFFSKISRMYKNIRETSTLTQDQAAKVAYFILSEKRTSSVNQFGHKFPFVTDGLFRPIISGAYNEKFSHTKLFKDHYCQTSQPTIFLRESDYRSSIVLNRPKLDLTKSYEEIYLDILKEQKLGVLLYNLLSSEERYVSETVYVKKDDARVKKFKGAFEVESESSSYMSGVTIATLGGYPELTAKLPLESKNPRVPGVLAYLDGEIKRIEDGLAFTL